jgi:MutS domain V
VTVDDVLLQYEGRLRELEVGIVELRVPHALMVAMLAISVGLFLAFGFYAIRGQVSYLLAVLPIPVAAVSARRLRLNRQTRSRMWRLIRFYDRALERMKGNWSRSDDISDEDHVYARDLNVFGEGSLLDLLSITRTSIGRRGLANYLLETPAIGETRLRQDAVRELRGRVDLREKVAELGEFDFAESNWATFEDWLDSPKLSFSRALPIMLVITSALLAALVLGGFDRLIPFLPAPIGILIVFHAAVGRHFRKRVNAMIPWVRPVSVETRVLREGLAVIAGEPFQSVKLRGLAEQALEGPAAIRKLELLLGALADRDKEWFYLPSRALLVGTQLCIAIEQWRMEHGDALRGWLSAWAEFEALNSLASYGYENPENVFPEVVDGKARFEAQALGHPLLARDSCVVNDVALSEEAPLYVISGSNMSGKSTLLRAIGLNAVLALAGAPVPARSLRISVVSIFASLSIVDSLLNGKSKFLAEVDRLRLAIEAASSKPVLFLIDEIFSGTNSRDRHIAAEAVVRTLVERGAIGALSTHDLALTEIAGAVNVHMGSRGEGDPMDFDYLLKAGVTRESNALAIARMAGVPV